VHSFLVDGDARWWEAWIGERADRYCEVLLQTLRLVVDSRAALRAKMEFDVRTFITYPNVLSGSTRQRNILSAESGLLTEGATCSALTGQAMTDGNAHWIANDLGRELTTAAGCEAKGHKLATRKCNWRDDSGSQRSVWPENLQWA
jgi:hypothetical protein